MIGAVLEQTHFMDQNVVNDAIQLASLLISAANLNATQRQSHRALSVHSPWITCVMS